MRSGNSSLAPTLFDSDMDDVPERGLLSESSTLYLELTADSSSIPLLLALRYEGEQREPASFLLTFPGSAKQKDGSRVEHPSDPISVKYMVHRSALCLRKKPEIMQMDSWRFC